MRTLKPEFWTDDVIVELSPWARLLYMGTWNFALCDQGHLDDSPKSLKLKILPADPVDAEAIVQELIDAGRLARKTTPDGRSYLHIPTLAKNTRADARWNSRCTYCAAEGHPKPVSAPPAPTELKETQESFEELDETPEKSPSGSKGREGKVKEGKKRSTTNVARKRATRPPDGEHPGDPESQGNAEPGSPGTPKVPRPARKPKPSGIKATRIPDDFAVTADMVAWTADNAPNVNGRRETQKFVNYWRGKAGTGATKLDWPATWRNWMLTAQTDAERNGARASPGNTLTHRSQQPARTGTDAKVAGWLALEEPTSPEEAFR